MPQPINIPVLMESIGLPELADVGTRNDPRLPHLINASIVGLSDGDLAVLHGGPTVRKVRAVVYTK